MTESVESVVNTSAEPSAQGAVLAGMMLKEARERAGLHIGALAVGLKVPVSKLEALEAGALEALSGPVFVRALAASVCRALKVDATDIMAHLPTAPAVRLPQNGHLNEPFRGADRSTPFSLPERMLKPSGLAVMALILGAALLMAWPHLNITDSSAEPKPIAPLFPPPMTDSKPVGVPEAEVPKAVQNADNVAQATQQNTEASAAKPAPLPPPPSSPASSPASSSVGAAVQASGVVVFKASGASWIEVTDNAGVVVLRKTLAAGESEQISGASPLKVVVGRADVTEVFVRGLRFDMQPWAKENVARFEVK